MKDTRGNKQNATGRRMEMNIDVEELQLFDGIAACANHTINFKIGKKP